MSDIVEMLRQGTEKGNLTPVGELCVEAAYEIESLRQQVKELKESQKTWNDYYRRQHHPRCDLLEAAGTDSLGNKCTCQQCIKEDVLATIKWRQEPVAWRSFVKDSEVYVLYKEKPNHYIKDNFIDEPLYLNPAPIPEVWQIFNDAYAKAAESSEPQDWFNAALLAKQALNATAPKPEDK